MDERDDFSTHCIIVQLCSTRDHVSDDWRPDHCNNDWPAMPYRSLSFHKRRRAEEWAASMFGGITRKHGFEREMTDDELYYLMADQNMIWNSVLREWRQQSKSQSGVFAAGDGGYAFIV